MPATAQSPAQTVLAASVEHRHGSVRLLLRTEAGAQSFIVGNVLAKTLGADLTDSAFPTHANSLKSHLSPERLERYNAARDSWRSGECRTQKAAAEKQGIPYGSFVGWLNNPKQFGAGK